jgi:hypothetical protein
MLDTMRLVLTSLICVVFLFLCPVRAEAQSYTGTASSMAYGYYNGSTYLYCFSEWFYSNSSGSYMWSGEAVKFELTISKYYDYSYFLANSPVSTNTITFPCGTGEWMVQQWNQTTVRVSGAKYISLTEGFYYSVSLAPKAYGSYRASYYASWGGFNWNGQGQTAEIDLTHP